jgi:CRP/FNR family transcriptional regulator
MIANEIEKLLDQTFPVVVDLPLALRQSMVKTSRHVSIPAGVALFENGDLCQSFPLLLTGSVRVIKETPEGRQMLLYRIEPGQFCLLTSSCLLGRSCYTASGIASTKSDLVLLTPSFFNELVNQNADFRATVFRLFSDRLIDLMQLVEEVAFRRLDQRLAKLLLSRGNEIHASHQALADELGSVRVIVSRILRNFEDDGWLSLEREHIRVLKTDAIKRLADGAF